MPDKAAGIIEQHGSQKCQRRARRPQPEVLSWIVNEMCNDCLYDKY